MFKKKTLLNSLSGKRNRSQILRKKIPFPCQPPKGGEKQHSLILPSREKKGVDTWEPQDSVSKEEKKGGPTAKVGLGKKTTVRPRKGKGFSFLMARGGGTVFHNSHKKVLIARRLEGTLTEGGGSASSKLPQEGKEGGGEVPA